jgi:GNAT superfamily N-acetyltransferase
MEFTVRPATAGDISPIAEWTRDTFDWGDYVADALADWLAIPNAQVQIATDASNDPLAVSLVQMLSPTEGWLSGARVHPNWRRRGLGSLLNQSSIDWIRSEGGVVARLAVETGNEAAVNQVKKLGYRPTSAWVFGELDPGAPAHIDRSDLLSRSGRSDVDPAWMYWSTSEFSEKGRALLASGWSWRRATTADIDRAARESRMFVSAAGWLIVGENPERLDVSWIAASQQDFPRLITGVRQLARERGAESVYFRIPATGWSEETLAREGVDTSPLTIFAKAVDG